MNNGPLFFSTCCDFPANLSILAYKISPSVLRTHPLPENMASDIRLGVSALAISSTPHIPLTLGSPALVAGKEKSTDGSWIRIAFFVD